MSFIATGRPRQPGASFTSNISGRVFGSVDGSVGLIDPQSVAPMGEGRIAQAGPIRSQARERVFNGAPKFWKITNRAQHGHVKVWMGVFDGEPYPEGAIGDDKSTWLQPGDSMVVPLEAGLHFVGNVFDPRSPEAREVIERTGGFELETESTAPGRNAPVRIIGGPIGLPDFVVEPMDGRGRRVGAPVHVYDLYWNATKRSVVRRKGHEPSVLEAEAELLAERIAEYTNEDRPLYGPDDTIISTVSVSSSASSEEAEEAEGEESSGLPDMRSVSAEAEEEDAEPVATRRRSR